MTRREKKNILSVSSVLLGVIQLIQGGENLFQIDSRSNKPIYEQIMDSVKENVVKDFLKAGDELPSVRRLAMELSVTPNTVAKAYRELERERVIEVIRGKGTYISSEYQPRRDEEKMKEIEKNITTNIVELAYMGLSKQEIVDIVVKIFESVKKEEKEC